MTRVTGVLRRYWWLLLGVVVVILGLALVTTSGALGNSSGAFGWFSYSPLTESDFDNLEQALNRRVFQLWAGVGVAVAGLLVIAVGAGYRLGQRQA
jgi:drug/metabolite transporter (DMT)-like permease